MTRLPFAFGDTHARQCAWCKAWRSDADRKAADAGMPVSHGICRPCELRLNAELGRAADEERAVEVAT